MLSKIFEPGKDYVMLNLSAINNIRISLKQETIKLTDSTLLAGPE